MKLRQTHTYVTLPLSPSAFAEIKKKLEDAAYQHTFIYSANKGLVIDMHGIGVMEEENEKDAI